MSSRAVLIANPASRTYAERRISAAREVLSRAGIETDLSLTRCAGDATALASEASKSGVPLVIAAGGDGTINEVMNGLAGSPTPLAIIPTGTTNVLAREICIPIDPASAARVAIAGRTRTAYLGEAAYCEGSRLFCLMLGAGFDAAAVYGVNGRLKKISGELAYMASGIREFLRYAPARLVVTVDGMQYECSEVIVGKASRYGGDYRVTPGASPFAPAFQVCMFQGRKRADLLRHAAGIVRGSLAVQKGVLLREGTGVTIKGEAHMQIDGDYLGPAPARIRIAERTISLVTGC